MEVSSILVWAKEETKTLTRLAHSHPRTKPAQVAEVLARKVVSYQPTDPKRQPYVDALLQHLTPLIRQTFFGSAAVNRYTLESEDYTQDAYVRVIRLLDRYFDPNKGSFISYAVMAFRQTASAMNSKQAALEAKEQFFSEQEEAFDLPAPAKSKKAQGTLTAWLREFIAWLDSSGSASLKELSRVAHVYWWYMARYQEIPTHSQVSTHLSISTQRLTSLRDQFLPMFRDYLCTYKDPKMVAAL